MRTIRFLILVLILAPLIGPGPALAVKRTASKGEVQVASEPLSRVKGVRAKSIVGGVTLRWKTVAGSDGYRIYRRTGPKKNKTTTWFDVAADQTRYRDKGLEVGERYTYQISALRGRKEGPRSRRASAIPEAPGVTGPSDLAQ